MDDLLAEFRHDHFQEEYAEDLPAYKYRFKRALDRDEAGLEAYQESDTLLPEEGGLQHGLSLDQSIHHSSQSRYTNDGETSAFSQPESNKSTKFGRCLGVLHQYDAVRDNLMIVGCAMTLYRYSSRIC